MKKLIIHIVCLIFVLTFTFSVSGEEKKEISDSDLISKSAVIIDAETGRILFGKNQQQKMAMASTTKIMT